MAVVEIVATRIIMCVVIPAAWFQTWQMRRADALTAAQKARHECRCGICGVQDILSAPLTRGGHDHH
ncbi:hypothetical protein SEA_MALISHA_94 [Gordonia phage Malisha]|nr:hypothetical protein SEA_MALISHA_94 [Gordonia phage Malisha]